MVPRAPHEEVGQQQKTLNAKRATSTTDDRRTSAVYGSSIGESVESGGSGSILTLVGGG